MSMLATIQFVTGATATAIPGAALVQINMSSMPDGSGYGGAATLVLRHLTEAVLPRIPEGGAVASITSVGGMGWQKNLENVKGLCGTPDFATGKAWLEAHPNENNGYLFSKQCIIWYTKQRAVELVSRRIRMNCLSAAPTEPTSGTMGWTPALSIAT